MNSIAACRGRVQMEKPFEAEAGITELLWRTRGVAGRGTGDERGECRGEGV